MVDAAMVHDTFQSTLWCTWAPTVVCVRHGMSCHIMSLK